MASKTIIKTTCSDCHLPVTVNRDAGTVKVHMPSNGKRGSLHVPAHDVVEPLLNDDGDLVTWDCPACGYADSYDLNYGS